MRVSLTVTEGPNQGLRFTFEEHSTFLVGRALEAHFRLPENDPYISRIQFFLEINPPFCRLVDTRSRNGTHVNSARVATADLRHGDVIQAGRTVLRVSLEESPGAAPAQTLEQQGSPPTTVSEAPEALPLIPGYELLRELGRGGMGIVYQARCTADGSLVAIKTILPAVQPSEDMLGRFLREARILRDLDHPHIVRFRDMGHTGQQLFFAMDFVPGIDADRLLEQQGPLAVGRAVHLIDQLLDALVHAHARGFVHRDIKPANLLVALEGGREVARLADFGLARTYQASQLSGLTMTGSAGGTAGFMPPEQVLDFRTVKPAADQYAAAATLYRLLTDMPLYDGAESNLDLMLKILQDNPVPLRSRRPDLPVALTAAVDRALARKPESRFANVSAFRQELAPFTMG